MLSEADKEFIANHQELTADELAEKTGQTKKVVENFIRKNPQKSRELKRLAPRDGVAIMQPGSSQMADELPKIRDIDQPHIHKMRDV